ncbi:hypothetical protein CR203_03860 [Salipaludibacillus neizhouensis]|uniref:EAL domain-containing protein n=1 Tax=Salipaludibacillus neizhouensis TaxID=885475 RepID=A0A3A9K9J5_9BACI|nr:EAL domain-containing protein [Salipaludibacillus neizhouensis]RKL69177.1 hypothetical protein CR203_03860 [Salipaludibacillus neizhouensis]
MDPIEVIENKEKVFFLLKPIMNSEEYRIIGYEVLGRIKLGDTIKTLSTFFLDPTVPAEYKWEIDKEIYHQAVQYALTQENKPRLFFNIDPSVLIQLDCLEELMELFQGYEREGFSASRVVFEFRVNDMMESVDDVSHMLMYMKASGFQVAIDDIKTSKTNLDYFSKLEPNIMKIDLSDLQESVNHFTYTDVLEAIAIFARKIGATLHFKGIRNFHQLYIAWRHGGRFLQGYYLHEPTNVFLEPSLAKEFLEGKIHTFIDMEHRRLQKQIEFLHGMDSKMIQILNEKDVSLSTDRLMQELTKTFKDVSFRMYICDMYGSQISANWLKENHTSWHNEEKARGKNWSWRTYFLDQIMQMKHRKMGMLSDNYRDIETNDLIRTYSYPVSDEHYVFFDLDPIFLFENDWLL